MSKTFKNLSNIKKIHMIGIGGVSMSGIAVVLKKAGFEVTGSDRSYGDMTDMLEKNGIHVFIGSNADLVRDADVVVYTSAISQHDSEYVKAKALGIPTMERAKFLGMLLKNYEIPICIAGTHGKTTTTSMTSLIFIDAGYDPNVQVGGKHKKLDNLNYRIGNSEYFILEACEYVDSFLNFPHHTATILNIDEDHLDYFSGIEEIKESFKKFILNIKKNGYLIMNKDDINSMDVLEHVKDELKEKNVTVYTFSLSDPTANIYAKNMSCNIKGFYSFDVTDNATGKTYSYYLTVPGIHNVYDALAAITTAHAHGIEFEKMKKTLNEFCGAKRRFELKDNLGNNILVYDDYSHHPTEVKATLAAAKQKHPNKIIAIFQPHTFSRTKELLDDFASAFYDADVVIIPDIYPAREIDDGSISSCGLIDKLKANKVNAIYIKDFNEIVKYVKSIMEPNDIVLTLGAGDVTKISEMF